VDVNAMDYVVTYSSPGTALPVLVASRLKLLLNHTNILRPQYHCVEDFDHIWGTNKEIRAALQDPVILQATCPYSHTGNGSPLFLTFF
jgi:hypothetical protein